MFKPSSKKQLRDAIVIRDDGKNGNINTWDISAIKDMSFLFLNMRDFNEDISDWDVSNVTNMSHMFQNCTSFNQDISTWDVSNVTNMESMFYNATNFNQDLNDFWITTNVINMAYMFYGATSFNQPLLDWDTSNVTNMESMFENATNFNQIINTSVNETNGEILWNVHNVTNMKNMFKSATSFNKPLRNWNVSKVTNMEGMFQNASVFNQSLYKWDVSNVINMAYMFEGATSFNQPLDSWIVNNVRSMEGMFRNASSFNQPLNTRKNEFGQLTWNVSNVVNMEHMFDGANKFNQRLTNWKINATKNNTNESSENISSQEYSSMEEKDISRDISRNISKNIGTFITKSKNKDTIQWKGYSLIGALYNLYLFQKYRSTCINMTSQNYDFSINVFLNVIDSKASSNNINLCAERIYNCIIRDENIIIIPIILTFYGLYDKPIAHENLLIYRKESKVFEHFEPHGSMFNLGNKNVHLYNEKIIDRLVQKINSKLPEDKKITLINSDLVCPYKYGIQAIEGKYSTNTDLDSGFCLTWTLFFTELALRNPDIPSKTLVNTIIQTTKGKHQPEFLRKTIIGYIHHISEILDKYFSPVFGEPITVNKIIEIYKTNNDAIIMPFFNKTIDVISVLINTINTVVNEDPHNNVPFEKQQIIKQRLKTAFENIQNDEEPVDNEDILTNFNSIIGKQRITNLVNILLKESNDWEEQELLSTINMAILQLYYFNEINYYQANNVVNVTINIDNISEQELKHAANFIGKHIKHKQEEIIIYIQTTNDEQIDTNLLIYNKNTRIFEYYEPFTSIDDSKIRVLIEDINRYLQKRNSRNIRFKYVNFSTFITIFEEENQIYIIWKILITIFAFKYPYLSSKEIIHIITNIMSGKNKEKFMRKMIYGFIIYAKKQIFNHYSNVLNTSEVDAIISVEVLLLLLEIQMLLKNTKNIDKVRERYANNFFYRSIFNKIEPLLNETYNHVRAKDESPTINYISMISNQHSDNQKRKRSSSSTRKKSSSPNRKTRKTNTS